MFLFNKKAPKKINFNGFHVAEVIYNGITVWVEKILALISGKAPLTLDASFGEDIVNYKIYGESEQEATPSITTPVEVESVGEYDEASGKYKIPVVVRGKNLFDYNKLPKRGNKPDGQFVEYNGVLCYEYRDGDTSGNYGFKYVIDFKENKQYTFTTRIFPGEKGGKVAVKFKYVDGSNKNYDLPLSSEIYSFTSEANKTLSSIESTYYNNTQKFIDLSVTQLEEGITATEYEPYHEPVTSDIYLDEPLRKIGDYADYIDFENGKVVRNIYYNPLISSALPATAKGQIFKTSTEVTSNKTRLQGPVTPKPNYSVAPLSNKLKGYTTTISYSDGSVSFSTAASNAYLHFKNSTLGFENVTEGVVSLEVGNQVRAFLNEQEIDITYVLAKPTETPMELPTLPTFEGTTIIEVNTNITPNVEINYYKQGG